MILLSVATTSKSLRAHHEGTQGKEDEHDTADLKKIFFVVETNINFRNFWETVIEYKVILKGTHLCFYRPLGLDLCAFVRSQVKEKDRMLLGNFVKHSFCTAQPAQLINIKNVITYQRDRSNRYSGGNDPSSHHSQTCAQRVAEDTWRTQWKTVNSEYLTYFIFLGDTYHRHRHRRHLL